MPLKPLRAGRYTRISSDRSGEAAGVGRQIEDCDQLIVDRGWTLAASFTDNDISAYSGRRRPEFIRLLAAIKAGELDVVVAHHVDRLYRALRDLVPLLDACQAAGVSIVTVKAGDIDISTAAGRTVASILGAVAEGESARQAERIQREKESRARAGKPNGSMRSFGYGTDGVIIEEEAAIIRELTTRVLAGESLRSLVFEMAGRQIPTVKGGAWRGPTTRAMLMAAKLSGQREWTPKSAGRNSRGLGEIVATEAIWEPIITREDTARLRALLGNPARLTMRPGRQLLTGVLMCGGCERPMNSHSDKKSGRSYKCIRVPGSGKCGKRSISGEQSDAYIRDAVLVAVYEGGSPARFADNQLAPDQKLADEEAALLAAQRSLAVRFGTGEITETEWFAARGGLEDRLRRMRSRAVSGSPTGLLAGLPDTFERMRDYWGTLHVDRQRAIIVAAVDKLVLNPREYVGVNRSDPAGRIAISWRPELGLPAPDA